MLYLKKTLLLLGLGAIGCVPSPESDVAMIALIANSGEYEHERVRTYGFLKKKDSVRLFVNREDALNDNLNHSIKLDDLTTAEFKEVELCSNQYVSVSGTLQLRNNILGFGGAIRIQGKPENTYSKIVCNQKFN